MSCLWLCCGSVPGPSRHCLQASSLSSWHRAIPSMFLGLSVTQGQQFTSWVGLGRRDSRRQRCQQFNHEETSLGKYVLTHMSLKAEQRAEIQWAFPRSPYMHRSHSSTGSLRWLSSTPATCYHTTIIPDRNLILCPLSSKHVQLGQF